VVVLAVYPPPLAVIEEPTAPATAERDRAGGSEPGTAKAGEAWPPRASAGANEALDVKRNIINAPETAYPLRTTQRLVGCKHALHEARGFNLSGTAVLFLGPPKAIYRPDRIMILETIRWRYLLTKTWANRYSTDNLSHDRWACYYPEFRFGAEKRRE
jgi:hypothetical protein